MASANSCLYFRVLLRFLMMGIGYQILLNRVHLPMSVDICGSMVQVHTF